MVSNDLDISKSGNLFFTHNPRFTETDKDSAFFYWHAFLGLVGDYNEDHPLWDDFDDVRGIPFREWWEDIAFDLFATGLALGAEVVDTEDEFRQALKEGEIVLRINPTCSRAWIDECIDFVLRGQKIVSNRGPKGTDDETRDEAKYVFDRTPDVRHLRICLEVYRYMNSGITDPVTIAEKLADEHRLVVARNAMRQVPKNIDDVERTIKRYYRNAKDIIEGVSRGEFPVY